METAPDAVALISGDDEITRSELAAWSDAIGSRLLDAGLLRGQVVGVHLERGPGFVAACLGIMRAGGLYLPLEPSSPSERLAVMADDSGLTLVVTDRPVPSLPGLEGTTAIDVAPVQQRCVCIGRINRVLGI